MTAEERTRLRQAIKMQLWNTVVTMRGNNFNEPVSDADIDELLRDFDSMGD